MITHMRSKDRATGRLSKWAALIGIQLDVVPGQEGLRPHYLMALPGGTFEYWLVYSTESEYEFRQSELSR